MNIQIKILIGFFAGFLLALLSVTLTNQTSHMREHNKGTHTTHEKMEVDAPVPGVDLVLHEEDTGAWNAEIILTNFSFAPRRVGTPHVAGEGHAHIYLDGVKVNRVYGEWYHVGKLSSGEHIIEVRLSTNDHKELYFEGAPVSDSVHVIRQ